jgi:TonB family protein
MIKYLFLFILGLFAFNVAFGQKDTSVYYLNNSGRVVSTKDSADFFLVILPPDTSSDNKLFVVKEFYPNGKVKLIGGSTGNSLKKLEFQGPYVAFYPNGHKKLVRNYKKSSPVGDEIEYYPNGKLYHVRTYTDKGQIILKQFNDSTGIALAENGKGEWKEYNENFTAINAEGKIDNGVEDGNWHGRINDAVGFESIFEKGKLISTSRTYGNHARDTSKSALKGFVSVEQAPDFPGGLDAFGRFLNKNVHYPPQAVKNRTQGRVIVSFVVERDGAVTNVKVARGIGDGCDEEAVRVIEMSPHWKPGIQNSVPVRVAYSVPITFKLP